MSIAYKHAITITTQQERYQQLKRVLGIDEQDRILESKEELIDRGYYY